MLGGGVGLYRLILRCDAGWSVLQVWIGGGLRFCAVCPTFSLHTVSPCSEGHAQRFGGEAKCLCKGWRGRFACTGYLLVTRCGGAI